MRITAGRARLGEKPRAGRRETFRGLEGLVGIGHARPEGHGAPVAKACKLLGEEFGQFLPDFDFPFEVPLDVILLGPAVAVAAGVAAAAVRRRGVETCGEGVRQAAPP